MGKSLAECMAKLAATLQTNAYFWDQLSQFVTNKTTSPWRGLCGSWLGHPSSRYEGHLNFEPETRLISRFNSRLQPAIFIRVPGMGLAETDVVLWKTTNRLSGHSSLTWLFNLSCHLAGSECRKVRSENTTSHKQAIETYCCRAWSPST